uniref:Uncharacterized protein n=1 Tax=Timema bartmani TaxID=61472 RepID=A0A7R9EPL2_9NEOP|nr:unnamed protein product [Timema bartmani]
MATNLDGRDSVTCALESGATKLVLLPRDGAGRRDPLPSPEPLVTGITEKRILEELAQVSQFLNQKIMATMGSSPNYQLKKEIGQLKQTVACHVVFPGPQAQFKLILLMPTTFHVTPLVGTAVLVIVAGVAKDSLTPIAGSLDYRESDALDDSTIEEG